jgi:mannose-6-phosphate isomerase-like protein (cupin superfamily)
MEMDKVNLVEKLAKFSDLWTPKVIAEMNNYQFKLVKIKGEFVWHEHHNTDEAFIVLEGKMRIEFENDNSVELTEGEMFIVPRGLRHKPCADEECRIMLVEPKGLVNTGNADSKLTAPNDEWV